MKTIIVTRRGIFKDGGTEEYQDKERNHYFIDKRINSKTKGKVFDKYPSDVGAKILDVILTERVETKLKIEREATEKAIKAAKEQSERDKRDFERLKQQFGS
jgi:hypothetical protein